MTKPISREFAEHYRWGTNCDGWFLLKDAEVHVIEERMPPGTEEQPHRHQRSRQLFYVLHGELTMRVDGADLKMRQGEAVEIEPGLRHQARNDSTDEVSFLVISAPPSHGDRLVD